MSDVKWHYRRVGSAAKWHYMRRRDSYTKGIEFRYPTHKDQPEGFWFYGDPVRIWVYRLAQGEWYGTFLPNVRYGPWSTKKQAQAVMLDIALYQGEHHENETSR